MKRLFLALSIVFVLFSCGLNKNPPSYVKDVVAYKEGAGGDRIVIYFILADSGGKMTTANGAVKLRIMVNMPISGDIEFFSETYNVKTSDFYKTSRGRGSLKEDIIIYSFGAMPFPANDMKSLVPTSNILVDFTIGENTISGKGTINW